MSWIGHLLLAVVPAVLAITLHEAAHGYAALAMGDQTARRAGRLSLNPLRHIDRVGTILLPGLLILVQMATIGRIAFMFGWAKPVPVNPFGSRNPRRFMALVAVAGPAANFLLAWLGALAGHLLFLLPPGPGGVVAEALQIFIVFNLVLGLFNLLPIPPLDGGRIMVGLLPERAAAHWARLERLGILLVLLVVFILPMALQTVGIQFDPVRGLLSTLVDDAWRITMRLAFYHD